MNVECKLIKPNKRKLTVIQNFNKFKCQSGLPPATMTLPSSKMAFGEGFLI